ncbi:hypothetical protein C8R42DRAFT_677158 [Lentinula raphanica]|nr:hypothetical protein C8R42DRAFT_677158 [Lentinula raphanica]
MPKDTATSKSSSPSTTRTALILVQSHHITERLKAIRQSRNMSMCPPCPLFNPLEEKLDARLIFNGATDGVNSPLHPSFHKLGKVVFVFKNLKKPKEDKRRVFEKDSIPIEALLADVDLMKHLGMRAAAANRTISRESSSSGSSPLPSSPPTPTTKTLTPATSVNSSTPSRLRVTPGTSRVLVAPMADPAVVPTRSVTNRLAPPVTSDRADPSDDEVEFVGFVHADGAIRPNRPLGRVRQQNVKARLSVGGSVGGSPSSVVVASSITLTIVAWTSTTYELQTVELPLQSGQYMKLSMISKVLRNMGLDINADLDRYIPGKEWALILMETLFKVHDGDVVNLKSSAVHNIPNFDIHLVHLG